jgi:hypothetical protein
MSAKRECRAVVNIMGRHYQCELDAPHKGLAHMNKDAAAIWCSDGEAVKYGKREKEGVS